MATPNFSEELRLTDDGTGSASLDTPGDGRSLMQGIAAMVAVLVALLILGGLAIAGFSAYLNWSAQRGARQFCDAALIGSDAAEVAARGRTKTMTVVSDDAVDLIFPSQPFSSVTCHLAVGHDGKVESKAVSTSND